MIKHFLLTILVGFAFILNSSATYNFPGNTFITGYDFRTFTKNGFLFTPDNYNGKYESIGLLNVAIYPEIKKLPTNAKYDTTNYEKR